MNELEENKVNTISDESVKESSVDKEQAGKKNSFFLPFILFVIVIGSIAGGGYQGWLLFAQYKQQTQTVINELKAELSQRPTLNQMDSSISTVKQSVGKTDRRLSSLEQGQQSLTNSTEKLYELYGRDENGWKLAEVEYLMSVAQHKLVLENDFEGAAKTLSAASDRIAELADPGLLSVRVKINEEIALLKTRARPDLVGMTLLVSRLTRQIRYLTPGYQTRASIQQIRTDNNEVLKESKPDQPLDKKIMDFMSSLVTVKTNKSQVNTELQAIVIDVTDKLEDNLKLTRWAVLERDAFQYERLMGENIKVFKEYYDLENAANADFYQSLIKLQKSQLNPALPDISASLRLLMEVQKKRENTPEKEVNNG